MRPAKILNVHGLEISEPVRSTTVQREDPDIVDAPFFHGESQRFVIWSEMDAAVLYWAGTIEYWI
jgi:hypothetical protein